MELVEGGCGMKAELASGGVCCTVFGLAMYSALEPARIPEIYPQLC